MQEIVDLVSTEAIVDLVSVFVRALNNRVYYKVVLLPLLYMLIKLNTSQIINCVRKKIC
jgi:hypothetical protein